MHACSVRRAGAYRRQQLNGPVSVHPAAVQECYDLTEALLERDPYALECLPAHLASALELKKKNQLFLQGRHLQRRHVATKV